MKVKFLHRIGHKHYEIRKDTVGTFSFCEQRWAWGGIRVTFRPGFSGSRWWGVPLALEDPDGKTVLDKMTAAESPHQAMALLRAAYEEIGEEG